MDDFQHTSATSIFTEDRQIFSIKKSSRGTLAQGVIEEGKLNNC